MGFSDDEKKTLIQNIRNVSNKIKRDHPGSDNIFDLLNMIEVPNADIIIDALKQSKIKNYDMILMRKRSVLIGVLIYNITLKYVGEILRKSCTYFGGGSCNCKISQNHGKICPGIHRCDDFDERFRRDYEHI